jgi:general secretion pathway protein I
LLEVLVALAIVAIALAAGLRATASLTRNGERQSEVLLAQLCAENTFAALRLARQLPAVGDSENACSQAGLEFTVAVAARPTPNPSFRRVEVQVRTEAGPVLRAATVIGRY